MKKMILMASLILTGLANTAWGQKLPQSQVPSVIVNSFQQAFPKAYDIKWEMDGANYQVEFETGYGTEHEVWYDKTGKLLRHVEELSKNNLPQKILDKLHAEYSGYRVNNEVDKITEDNKTHYILKLKSVTGKWKMVFDGDGNVLSKTAD